MQLKHTTDVPAEVLANFFLGMLRTRARDLEGAPEAVRQYGVMVDLFLRGAGPGSDGAATGSRQRPSRRVGGRAHKARRPSRV